MQNNFLMDVKFGTSWGVTPVIFKIWILGWLFSKIVQLASPRGYFWDSNFRVYFFFRYVEGGVLGNNNSIKKCKTTYGGKIWVKLESCPINFQNLSTCVTFFKNGLQLAGPRGCFWKFSKISPTCPKFNTHKKIVVHFFIQMLLLPKTPPSTYLKIKKIKGPKVDHFHFFFFTFHFTSLHFTSRLWFDFSQFSPKKWHRLHFYKRNPFKNESNQKKKVRQ